MNQHWNYGFKVIEHGPCAIFVVNLMRRDRLNLLNMNFFTASFEDNRKVYWMLLSKKTLALKKQVYHRHKSNHKNTLIPWKSPRFPPLWKLIRWMG